MTFLKTGHLLACLFILTQCRAQSGELPISFMDYLAIHNGHFRIVDADKDGDGGQGSLEFVFKPVNVPGLQKEPALFMEESFNGTVYRRVVIVQNESSTDTHLFLNYYNFTDTNISTSGAFNTDDFDNLKHEDFHISEGCHAAYEAVATGVLSGIALDCRHTVNGQHPFYTTTLRCDEIYFASPVSADETTRITPFHLEKVGQKYPMVGAPEGYVNPCQDDR